MVGGPGYRAGVSFNQPSPAHCCPAPTVPAIVPPSPVGVLSPVVGPVTVLKVPPLAVPDVKPVVPAVGAVKLGGGMLGPGLCLSAFSRRLRSPLGFTFKEPANLYFPGLRRLPCTEEVKFY